VYYEGDVNQAADLYLATQIQQQLLFFVGSEGLSPHPRPLLRQDGFITERALLDVDSEQIPAGRYQIYQVLTRADGDIFNPEDWLSGLSTLNFIIGETQASSRDFDNDGFSDDDINHDGYHDGDHDHDGYDDEYDDRDENDEYDDRDENDEYDDRDENDEYDDRDENDEYDDRDENDEDSSPSVVNPNSPIPPAPPASNTYPDGARLLASQCFQCHGTEGISITGIDSLREESDEIAEEMFEMKYSNQPDDIMHRHAMGYSDEEIRSIDAYFRALYNGGR
jgi:cytochrome c553